MEIGFLTTLPNIVFYSYVMFYSHLLLLAWKNLGLLKISLDRFLNFLVHLSYQIFLPTFSYSSPVSLLLIVGKYAHIPLIFQVIRALNY